MPNLHSIVDITPNNLVVANILPNNVGNSIDIQEQQYSLVLGAGMLIPLGYLTYPVSQTIISSKSP